MPKHSIVQIFQFLLIELLMTVERGMPIIAGAFILPFLECGAAGSPLAGPKDEDGR